MERISWLDKVTDEEILTKVDEGRYSIYRQLGHISPKNFLGGGQKSKICQKFSANLRVS